MPVGESTLEELLHSLLPHYKASDVQGACALPIEQDMSRYLAARYPELEEWERGCVVENLWRREINYIPHTKREASLMVRSRDFYRSFVLDEGSVNIQSREPRSNGPRKLKIGLVDFKNPANNQWRVSRQTMFRDQEGAAIKLDLMIWLNGLPLVLLELKADDYDLEKAQNQLDGYVQRQPDLGVSSLFLLASNAQEARYGAIHTPHSKWQRVLSSSFSEHLQRLAELLQPAHLLHMLESFVLYSRKSSNVKKIIPRAQQMEAVDAILQRVKDPDNDKGLIKHHQGSGKTFLMIYAARAARRHWREQGIKNSKVLLLVDRTELLVQLRDQFKACQAGGLSDEHDSHPDIIKAETRNNGKSLADALAAEQSRVLVATIQSAIEFPDQESEATVENPHILVLCDECHRTQAGSLGQKLRALLPNATYIGFTGTPIASQFQGSGLTDQGADTYLQFGNEKDKGRLLHAYSMEQAMRDGVVVSLRVVDRRTQIDYVNRDAVDSIAPDSARLKSVNAQLSSRNLLDKVIPDALKHYQEIAPWKAIFVAGNRYGCVQLYEALLRNGISQNEIAISFSPSNRTKKISEEEPDIEQEPEDEEQDEQREEVEAFYLRRVKKQEDDQVKAFADSDNTRRRFLVVTSKRLTGFDAPVAGAIYLVKNMARPHALFQAITRVNRAETLHREEGPLEKEEGVIVNYALPMRMFSVAVAAIEGERSGYLTARDAQNQLQKLIADAHVLLSRPEPSPLRAQELIREMSPLLAAGHQLNGEERELYRQLMRVASEYDPRKRQASELSDYVLGQISQHVHWSVHEGGEDLILAAKPSALQIQELEELIAKGGGWPELEEILEKMPDPALKQQSLGQWLLRLQEELAGTSLPPPERTPEPPAVLPVIQGDPAKGEKDPTSPEPSPSPAPEPSPEERSEQAVYEAALARARSMVGQEPGFPVSAQWARLLYATRSLQRVMAAWGWRISQSAMLRGEQDEDAYRIRYEELLNLVVLPLRSGLEGRVEEAPYLLTDGVDFRLHDGEQEFQLELSERLSQSPLFRDCSLPELERIRRLGARPSLLNLLAQDAYCYALTVLSTGDAKSWKTQASAYLPLQVDALWRFIEVRPELAERFSRLVGEPVEAVHAAAQQAGELYPRELAQAIYGSRLIVWQEEGEWVLSESPQGAAFHLDLRELARAPELMQLHALLPDRSLYPLGELEPGQREKGTGAPTQPAGDALGDKGSDNPRKRKRGSVVQALESKGYLKQGVSVWMLKDRMDEELQRVTRSLSARDPQLEFVFCGLSQFHHAIDPEDAPTLTLSFANQKLRAVNGLPENPERGGGKSVADRFSLSPGGELLAAHANRQGYWLPRD